MPTPVPARNTPTVATRSGAVRLAHFCGGFRGLGGVESVLQRHWSQDAAWGVDSRFLVYFEKESAGPPVERVTFLDLGAGSTIRQCRRRIANALGPQPPEVAVYHGFWGMPYLADLDRAGRRLLFLHGDVPRFEEYLVSRGPWVDGVLCVSRPLEQSVRRMLPGLAPERVRFIPYPVFPPEPSSVAPRPGGDCARERGGPLVIGVCGRIIREQKRVDRFPALLQQLDAAGIEYRLEFLGDGPERAWLEGALAGNRRVMFHGRKSGADYWRILAAWDVILFVSDYEGTPIAMVEAMTQGVIPVYPRILSGGDGYAETVREDLLYAPDDFAHVTQVMRALAGLGGPETSALRRRARDVVAGHTGDEYHRTFTGFLEEVRSLPRVGTGAFPRRPFPIDYLSFTALERLGTARRRVRRLLGRG